MATLQLVRLGQCKKNFKLACLPSFFDNLFSSLMKEKLPFNCKIGSV